MSFRSNGFDRRAIVARFRTIKRAPAINQAIAFTIDLCNTIEIARFQYSIGI